MADLSPLLAAASLDDVLLNPLNIALSAGVWTLIKTLDRVFAGSKAEATWARLLPLLPLLLCMGGYFLIAPEDLSVGIKLAIGFFIGASTAHGEKALKQSAFGRDTRIAKTPKGSSPAVPPASP